MEEVKTNNNTDAKVVTSLLGDSNNKVARYCIYIKLAIEQPEELVRLQQIELEKKDQQLMEKKKRNSVCLIIASL